MPVVLFITIHVFLLGFKCKVVVWNMLFQIVYTVIHRSLTHFWSCRLKIPCFCQKIYLIWFIYLLWWIFRNVNKEVMNIDSTWKRQPWGAQIPIWNFHWHRSLTHLLFVSAATSSQFFSEIFCTNKLQIYTELSVSLKF